MGDITLHEDASYFQSIKQQLDFILRTYFVHFYFVAEAPQKRTNEPAFPFLPRIFLEDESTRVTYINSMDVPTTLIHMMNADMLITTGSSFPYIAASVSPKVRNHMGLKRRLSIFFSLTGVVLTHLAPCIIRPTQRGLLC